MSRSWHFRLLCHWPVCSRPLFGRGDRHPGARLRGDYLAIITLGFGEIIRVMANAEFLKPITNGAMGLGGIKTFGSRNPATMFVYVFVTMALVIFISFTFGRSRHGGRTLPSGG